MSWLKLTEVNSCASIASLKFPPLLSERGLKSEALEEIRKIIPLIPQFFQDLFHSKNFLYHKIIVSN
jgi:hypothetical protein